MINLGILGAGRIAVIMAETVRKMNESGDNSVKLYGVASRDAERARIFAEENGVENSFGSYEEMLCDDNVQLIYIATPHSHHYEHAMLCLEHGKHVLCEKAFTVNVRQAEDLVRFAKQRNLLITEAIWTRYQPMRAIINDTIASGVIGEPKMLTANLCYAMTEKERVVEPYLAGGALLDVGIYALNFAEMVFGHADGVNALCVKSDKGVDIYDSITLTWNDGRMAVLNSGATCVSDRYGVVYGTTGFLMVENINNPQSIRVYDADYQLVQEIFCPKQFTGYEYEVLEAARCVEAGALECPSMPHSETLHVMELMDHIRAQMALRYPFE